jgi:hypothetical protein
MVATIETEGFGEDSSRLGKPAVAHERCLKAPCRNDSSESQPWDAGPASEASFSVVTADQRL